MPQPEQSRPASEPSVELAGRRVTLPSWAISALLHLVLILVLGLVLRLAPSSGAAADRTAEVGIVLRHQRDESRYYEGPEDARQGDAASSAASAGNIGELLADGPPTDPSSALPSPLDVIGPGALDQGGVGSAVGAAAGPPSNARALGGKARTGVFGIEGEGYKFVYVFDRSASMGGAERDLLGAAKSQLSASLESLEKTHQFQIIFYNDRLTKFNPSGDRYRLVWATDQNKALAARFLGSVTAAGATEHEQALTAAIKLQPDVIFFLTDADEPKMGPGQLEKIRRRAVGITIHAIEFGIGSQQDPNNFLVKLARQNGGRHGYIDVTKLFPVQRP
jgi:hypothetical protein